MTEAANHVNRYFATYRRDLQLSAAPRIAKRIQRALARAAKGAAAVQAAEHALAPDRTDGASRRR